MAHFYVSYSNPAAGLALARDNNMRWQGPGELEISARQIKFRARKMLRWRPITHVVSVGAVVDVEQLDLSSACTYSTAVRRPGDCSRGPATPTRRSEIARQLPASRASDFATALAEGAAFFTTLATVTSKTRVAGLLIGAQRADVRGG